MFIVNMSVWESVEALGEFVYRSDHRDVLRERRQWFEHLAEAYLVLWWIPAATLPTVQDGMDRLRTLRQDGPTPEAFTFRQPFPPPASSAAIPVDDDWFCPA